MFGSIKSFFTDIVAPVGITILSGGNPLPAAAYMGIKTGIETGSPLAGIGSAAFSYGLSSLMKPITQSASEGLGSLFGEAAAGASDIGQSIITKGGEASLQNLATTTGVQSTAGNLFSQAGLMKPLEVGTSEAFKTVGGKLIERPLQSASSGILGGLIDTSPVPLDPSGLITDKAVNPAYIAAGGLGLQMAATPPEAPAPLTMQPPAERDFSKYNYKGPLDRGEYTYPDPEDLAYGRVSPDSYGYIGAKAGGQIKKFQMGGFSPLDPRMKPVDSRTASQNINIMSPPSGVADPTPSANFLATGKIDTVPPGISQLLKAGKAKSKTPKGSPLQTMKQAEKMQKPPQTGLGPMPMPSPSGLPDITRNFGDANQMARLDKMLGVIPTMPRKDLNVNLGQVRGLLGLAEGGDVPGMAKELPAGALGPSSTVDMSAVNYGKPTPGIRKKFDDQVGEMFANMLGANRGGMRGAIGKLSAQMLMDQQGDAMFKYAQDNNLLRGIGGTYQGPLQRSPYRYPTSAENLALGKEDVSKIGYANVTYPGTKNMAQGGEVESNKTLQENAFVIPADVVGHLGDGSSDAGAQKLQGFFGMNPQQYQAGGIMAGELQGPGGGMDDLIQTSIEGKQAAAVSPQEFVVPRDVVAKLGKGSYDQGSKKLYSLMKNVRKVKTGTTKQPNELTLGLNQLMSA